MIHVKYFFVKCTLKNYKKNTTPPMCNTLFLRYQFLKISRLFHKYSNIYKCFSCKSLCNFIIAHTLIKELQYVKYMLITISYLTAALSPNGIIHTVEAVLRL